MNRSRARINGGWFFIIWMAAASRCWPANASGGSISTDGKKMAYSDESGIRVIDLATKSEQVLTGTNGFNLNWSPDGKQIAFIKLGDGDIDTLFTANLDGSGVHKVSDWSYQSVVGAGRQRESSIRLCLTRGEQPGKYIRSIWQLPHHRSYSQSRTAHPSFSIRNSLRMGSGLPTAAGITAVCTWCTPTAAICIW